MTGPDRIWAWVATLKFKGGEYGELCQWHAAPPIDDPSRGTEYIRADLHTAALSAEYERGLRRAERLLRDEYGLHDAASAILALIPLSPSPVDASRGADPDNKEPTDDR